MSGISEVIGPTLKIVPKKHGEHEQAFASPLPLWERVPRQGQERGGLGLSQPCFALNRRPLSCPSGILPTRGEEDGSPYSAGSVENGEISYQ
ncbi:hypothetical protein FACS1894158_00100 [Betaproteobacteria bacterium]|nr:hypothetical protein FACS1894158_00100 [Betaproteobacteria bacterium]